MRFTANADSIDIKVMKKRKTIHGVVTLLAWGLFIGLLGNVLIYEALPVHMIIIYIVVIVLFTVMGIISFYELFRGRYTYWLHIDLKGVEYHKRKKVYTMVWEDIDRVVIMPDLYGYNKSATICFMRKGADPCVMTGRIEKFSPDFFGVQYRECVVTMIRRYWHEPIENIEKVW